MGCKIQGAIVGGPNGYFFDTTYTFTTIITPSGTTDSANGHLYLVYNANFTQGRTFGPAPTSHTDFFLYIREDTANKQIRGFVRCATCSMPNIDPVILDYNKAISDATGAICSPDHWKIDNIDSLTIGGKQYKRWTIARNNKQLFYQAYLIGGQTGILPLDNAVQYTGQCSQIKSLDFIYESDSLHFDIDYGYHF